MTAKIALFICFFLLTALEEGILVEPIKSFFIPCPALMETGDVIYKTN